MRIAVVGTRGIPGVHGGVERHCEELYPRLAEMGDTVRVYCRSPYAEAGTYESVELATAPYLSGRGLEALTHTFSALWREWRMKESDLIHFHSVGPSLFAGLARRFGFRVVATLHAPDYEQKKWGGVARWILRTGQRQALAHADAVIVVSEDMRRRLEALGRSNAVLIPNAPPAPAAPPQQALAQFEVEPGAYVLFVGRLIPDKRVEDVIQATADLGAELVVAGGSSDTDAYERRLRAIAHERVRFVGYVHGEALAALYAHAGVYVLPSALEGSSISLLEAMSYSLPCVASDIAPNREAAGDEGAVIYPLGDTGGLGAALGELLDSPDARQEAGQRAAERFREWPTWDRIAESTQAVYRDVLEDSGGIDP